MYIAVIAAQGRSGQEFVRVALDAGHHVRAGIGKTNPFQSHERLTIVRCDATDAGEVSTLLQGSDVVVSLLGHVPGSKSNVQTQAMKVITEAMARRGITRLVSLTGTGVRRPGDRPSLIDRLANWAIARIDSQRVSDGIAHAALLDTTHFDVTIVRVLKLWNSNTAAFSLSEYGPAKLLTSRREVALAILDIVENNRYIGKYPVISRP
jgi:nucleoside-diphosphate-sugar epimerase